MALEDKVVRQLLEIYRQGFLALILLLEQYKGRPSEWFYKQQMKQVLDLLQQLDQNALEWIIQQLTKIYQQNYLAVYNMLLQLGKEPDVNPSFAQLHTRAIEVVAMAITDSLHGAIQTVGRQINDVYRQESLKMVGKKFTAGLTWQQAKKELEQQLLNLNITGFKDRLGRNWKLGTYTAMVARTLTREVATVATINACKEFNIKLVKITWHAGACEMCRPIEGKIFTLDPRDKRYPYYDGKVIRVPVHPNCYDKETEVYTRNGWKLIKDVQIGEECLSLNPKTLEMEFVKVVDKVSYVADKLIHFYHPHFDLMVTFNHMCLWQDDESRKRYGINKGWRFVEAQELLNKKSGRFLRIGRWQGIKLDKIKIGNIEMTHEQYAKLMGWYLSEGSCDNRLKRIQIAQSKDKNLKKWLEIKALLDEIGCKYSYNNERFVIYCGLYDYLKQFGKSHEKYVPEEIKNAHPRIIRLFLDTYRKGDGYERESKKYKGGNFDNEKIYFTSSKKLADDIGELILKVGKRPSFDFEKRKGQWKKFKNGEYEIKTDIWIVRECNSETAALRDLRKEIVEYNDYVFCVELEKYHTLYVRRNGKCVWSGNCRHVLTPYVDIAAELEEMEKDKKKVVISAQKSGIIDIERRKEWLELDEKAKSLFTNLTSSVVDMAKELLQRTGVKIPVYAEKIKDRGYVEVDYKEEKLKCIAMFLQSNDYRDYAYRQRTVLHELYHANAQGLKHDIKSKEHFRNVWCRIEDTFAECFAHYATKIAGIEGGEAPAYPRYIASILPALKRRIKEFEHCKTIEDFGRVAFKLRFIDKKATWDDIYAKVKDFDVIGYVKEHYLDYIEKNKDEIVEVVMQNSIPPEKREEMRETMRAWLNEAIRMVKNGEDLLWMPEQIFYDSVAIAMKRLGVK